MLGLFSACGIGKRKHHTIAITSVDEAVLEIKIERDKLRMYERRLVEVYNREDQAARELLKRGEKDRAKLALQRKVYQKKLMEQANGMIDNLNEMVNSMDMAEMQREFAQVMATGKKTLDSILSQCNVEDVERLMEETQESLAYADEVADLLSGTLSTEDFADCDDELDAIAAELAMEDAEKITPAPVTAKESVESVQVKPIEKTAAPVEPTEVEKEAVEESEESESEEELAFAV
ncbi:snf7 family protein [Carpediemonas membranifera]|uniref:Snf7 family protein n=1 Tax=Carpediemonas membranifera TaxID=201153 RepID=A0A8J6AXR1_9EUKA|nr:snf7 family protein [Carpediemonas membranifera]|eukprot:KAG9390993.1 snf7 family protein [Carpediemonas membranifera]